MNTLRMARWLRRHGLATIALPYRAKRPDYAWMPYQERQATDSELAQWFGGRRANIAVVNGRVSGNAVSVDVDEPLLFENVLDASGVQRRSVRSLVTRSSRGGHIWLRSEKPVATNLGIAEHVELRSSGTITLVPPSVHPSGTRYRFLGLATGLLVVDDAEAWLRELLGRLSILTRDRGERRAADPVEMLSRPIPQGERNRTLARVAGYLHNYLPLDWTAALVHAVNDARSDPQLPAHEVAAIIDSISRYEQRFARSESRERELIESVVE